LISACDAGIGFDCLVETHKMLSIASQSNAANIDRLDSAERVALDTWNLQETTDGHASSRIDAR
jgi:hypothetical protein